MLYEIIKKQTIDLVHQQQKLPLKNFQTYLSETKKDFYTALSKNTPSFIFECKYQSPSKGVLLEEFPINALADKFARFADVISVLTNKPYFGGCYAHLRRVSQTVDVPVLCKDIIIDPYQISLARFYGADAVLLMLSVLDDKSYHKCARVARELNMGILTEVHTVEELERAKKLEAIVIGINHRNLKTLEIDMRKIPCLLPFLPENRIIIAESGIESHSQINALSPHVNGFLIGTALTSSHNIDHKMRELIFGNIKICGLTCRKDIEHAASLGASFGGLNFIPSSKRSISLFTAKKIIRGSNLNFVGIFANHSITTVINFANELNLFAIQLHGNEDETYVALLKQSLPISCKIWLAKDGNLPIPTVLPPFVDKLVLDNSSNSQLGGTGQTFNWNKIKDSPILSSIILAGGINIDNVVLAKSFKTWGLDINSGVENKPGNKSFDKLKAIFNRLRGKTRDKT